MSVQRELGSLMYVTSGTVAAYNIHTRTFSINKPHSYSNKWHF